MRPDAEPWWEQAEADLETGFENFERGRHFIASWLAQQAVEKGLKAMIVDRSGQSAPRTHDLEYLGRLIQAPAVMYALLSYLDVVFDMARYPDDTGGSPPVRRITASAAASDPVSAEKVMLWIRSELKV